MSSLINPQLEGSSFLWGNESTGIMLIHGYTATTAEVRPLAHALHQHGYTTAGPLLPGHGSTPEKANRAKWQDWTNACEQTYHELAKNCQRVFVGGESMGALLSLYLATSHTDIAGLLLYAPALRVRNFWEPWLTPWLALVRPIIPKRTKTPAFSNDRWQGYGVHPLRATTQLFALQRIIKSRLSTITQPLLIIQGRLDATVHPDVPEQITNMVNSNLKEIHWLEKSRHCVILDIEWQQAVSITLNFLSRIAESEGKLSFHDNSQKYA